MVTTNKNGIQIIYIICIIIEILICIQKSLVSNIIFKISLIGNQRLTYKLPATEDIDYFKSIVILISFIISVLILSE